MIPMIEKSEQRDDGANYLGKRLKVVPRIPAYGCCRIHETSLEKFLHSRSKNSVKVRA